jgi:hypothetical protein
MLRIILMLLALIVLAAAVLVWLGVINLNVTQEARLPSGGQMPEVQLKVNPVEVNVEPRNVQVPVPVIRPVNEQAPANAQ